MNLIDKAFLLKKTSLFGALDLDLLLSIADKMESMHYRSSEFIFNVNSEAFRMYLIIGGKVSVLDRQGAQLAELVPGDFFGDESMFNEKPRGYAAFSKTKVELLSISRSHLLSVIQECPSVALALLEAYSSVMHFRLR